MFFRLAELRYFATGNLKYLITKKVANEMKNELINSKYIAPVKKCIFPVANPKPAVHKGGINAVAMATPLMTLKNPFFVKATIPASPPKKAMSTSKNVGDVRAKSSFDS